MLRKQLFLNLAILAGFTFLFLSVPSGSVLAQLVVTDGIEKSDLPFNIEYPSGWYARKEGDSVTDAYFFSREQIKRQSDQFRAGVSIMISKGLAARAADWNAFKQLVIGASRSQGAAIEELPMDKIDGYTAFAFIAKSSRNSMWFVYIMKDQDIATLVLESPNEEWDTFKPIYAKTIENFSFKK